MYLRLRHPERSGALSSGSLTFREYRALLINGDCFG